MHTRIGVALTLLLAVAACSGDPAAPGPTAPGPNAPGASGSLAITITGLPAGDRASVSVTGPAGIKPVTVLGSRTLTGLPVGDYTIVVGTVSHGSTTYGSLPLSQVITVSGSTPVAVEVVYAAMTGQLTVTVNGPPGGLASEVIVYGPGVRDAIRVSGATTLTGLPLGSYSVVPSPMSNGSTTYVAPTAYLTIDAGQLNGVAAVMYVDVASVVSLTLNITGLPNGVGAAVVVSLPCPGYAYRFCHSTWTYTKSASLHLIRSGTYGITASPVTVGTTRYTAMPAFQTVVVRAGLTGPTASVVYAP